jgi:hypothetical protein
LAKLRNDQHWSEVETSDGLREDKRDLQERLDAAVSREELEAMQGLATINDQYRMALDKMDRAEVCERVGELCMEGELLRTRAPEGTHADIRRAIEELRLDRLASIRLPTTERENATQLAARVTQMTKALADYDEGTVNNVLEHYRQGSAAKAERLRREANEHIAKADSMRRPVKTVPYNPGMFTREEHDAIKEHHEYIKEQPHAVGI